MSNPNWPIRAPRWHMLHNLFKFFKIIGTFFSLYQRSHHGCVMPLGIPHVPDL
ncbi:MAG: hypothetical protein HRT91_04340 [Piscirickettsiaceae bacterium]|nr:hypothetical protein [Piscirickettsiaceae bacterium]